MTIPQCAVCSSANLETLYPEHEGVCVTSDMMVLRGSSLRNRICVDCGLIFNAGGPRGDTEAFYRDSYCLMMRNPGNAIQSFSGAQPISQAERTFQILKELVELEPSGRILEAGAGKGDFLQYFTADLPDWRVSAFEPSSAFKVLKERYPAAQIQRCDYRSFPTAAEPYDLVVALGVLEHVENPFDMLVWANELLQLGGVAYIRVPHFANNPNDLFCADHLSKLTEGTLRSLAAAGGFEMIGRKEAGVPIFVALRKIAAPNRQFSNVFAENKDIADRNVSIARAMMDAILDARRNAQLRNEHFGIFGLGSSGLFAPLFESFSANEIVGYVDENQSVWGGEIHGRPIGGLDLIDTGSIKHVALAISPVYNEKVTSKLQKYGVQVYSAKTV